MSAKTLLRENQSLRRRITQLQLDHAKAMNAKTQALEEAHLGDLLFQLGSTFPDLRKLVGLLRRAHHAAVPLVSPTGDRRTTGTPTPLESGAATKTDRKRVDWINTQVKNLCDGINVRMSTRGPLNEKGPQCWEADCPARGWFQPFDAEVCVSCEKPFGRFKPVDRTRLITSAKRCWTRDCPQYSKTNQCEHSFTAA